MGILDLIGGFGKAGAAPWMDRLSKGMVRENSMLHHMGLGGFNHPAQGGLAGLGGGGLQDFLSQLGGAGGQGEAPQQPPAQQPPAPPANPAAQSGGLAAAIAQFLQQQQRR